MISMSDTVEITGKGGRRAKGWNISQSNYLGKRGIVVGIREIRGKPDQYDIKFPDGRTLAYEEDTITYYATSLANLSL